jgi:putative flippase GtrA
MRSFARFVLLGGGVGLLSSAAVPVAATSMPWVVANALVTIASTLLGTELHARFTFGAGRRAQWHQHVQSAGSAVVAYLVTSVAVLGLHVLQPAAGVRWEQAVYLGASAVAGTGRFLVLRLYVFARHRGTAPAVDAPPDLPAHADHPSRVTTSASPTWKSVRPRSSPISTCSRTRTDGAPPPSTPRPRTSHGISSSTVPGNPRSTHRTALTRT